MQDDIITGIPKYLEGPLMTQSKQFEALAFVLAKILENLQYRIWTLREVPIAAAPEVCDEEISKLNGQIHEQQEKAPPSLQELPKPQACRPCHRKNLRLAAATQGCVGIGKIRKQLGPQKLGALFVVDPNVDSRLLAVRSNP